MLNRQFLNKDKIFQLFIPAVILSFIVITSLLVVRPTLTQVLKLQKELSAEKSKLARITAKLSSLKGLDEVELDQNAKIALRALPAEKNFSHSLATIKTLITLSGLELRGMQVEPGEISTQSAEARSPKKYGLNFLEFKLVIAGSLSQLKDFLGRIESVAPIMRINDVEFSQTPPETIVANIILDTFFLPLPTTLGAVDEPLTAITRQEEDIYRQMAKIQPALETTQLISAPSGKENPFSP